ncbi:geraniol 8-hydroxylase-like [Cryptomeria japonica]|uniref:geraniol 8-hydroxylase-like n=1 Tax=Cryptomeria japonica TaxID=3369 RepID=UPI0027DA9FB2|nr:geraniol 8-hydroxylase-like [Cryptomeria japonica]
MDFSSSLSTLIFYCVVATVISVVYMLTKLRSKPSERLPPGPRPWPLIGNILQVGKNVNESFSELAKIHGPLMTLHLGWRTTVVASSPAMARQVLQTQDQSLSARTMIEAAKCLEYGENSLVWRDCVPRWRTLRRICTTQLFTVKRLEALHQLRREQVRSMMRAIYKSTSAPLDIGHAAFLTSFNMVGNMLFSKDMFDWDESEKSKEFKKALNEMLFVGGKPNWADYFPFLKPFDPQGIRKEMTRIFRIMFAVFDQYIDERLQSGTRSEEADKDFLDILLESKTETGEKLTKFEITRFFYDLFTAGSETTSNTIEWAMSEIIRNPMVMEKVRDELDKVVGKERRVQESDIDNLPYLHSVVKETFRLHPVSSLLIHHRALNSCEIEGYVIPKDAQVFVNVWAIGRDPNVWQEPERFFPERFMDSDVEYKGQNFELLPFGSGRRMCPGIPLAHKIVHVVVATLLQCFDWQLPNGQNPGKLDMSAKFGITLQKAEHLVAIPTPRLPHHIYN